MTQKKQLCLRKKKRAYNKPLIASYDLPPQLSVGICNLDPGIWYPPGACQTTTGYEQAPGYFPPFACL